MPALHHDAGSLRNVCPPERLLRFYEGGGVKLPSAVRLVILCRTEAEARAALGEVQDWVAANGLALHPDKTRCGDCRVPGEGFEFLG